MVFFGIPVDAGVVCRVFKPMHLLARRIFSPHVNRSFHQMLHERTVVDAMTAVIEEQMRHHIWLIDASVARRPKICVISELVSANDQLANAG
jgi:hypothetical protein